MKMTFSLLLSMAGLVFLAGCQLESAPYRSHTVAAAILKSTDDGKKPGIQIPVVTEGDATNYLVFSDVICEQQEREGQKNVTIFSAVSMKKNVWRVGLFKGGKEFYHFVTSNQSVLFGDVIPLGPLALDPTLAMPDKIVVTRIEDSEN